MRRVTIRQNQLFGKSKRLDARFYLGGEQVESMTRSAEARFVKLGHLLEVTADDSRLLPCKAGIPMIRLSNVNACDINFSQLKYVFPENGEKWTAVKKKDVLFTQAAEPFRAAVLPESVQDDITVSSEIAVLRPRPALVPEYLAAILSTKSMGKILRDIAYRRSSTALRRLRLKDIKEIPIPLPGRSIQEAIKKSYEQAAYLGQKSETELSQIIKAVHAEIDRKIGEYAVASHLQIMKSDLGTRWDVSFATHSTLRTHLMETGAVEPLLNIAKAVPSTLKGMDEEESILAVRAEHINEATLLVESFELAKLATLSPRMRQPLHPGDVLICTTGIGNQVAFLDEIMGPDDASILGSTTFTALRFAETPRYFTIALTHPVVRRQFECLATGTAQPFVSKKDLDALLIPMLSQIWREDFDSRVAQAFERRREALEARDETLRLAETFFQEEMEQ